MAYSNLKSLCIQLRRPTGVVITAGETCTSLSQSEPKESSPGPGGQLCHARHEANAVGPGGSSHSHSLGAARGRSKGPKGRIPLLVTGTRPRSGTNQSCSQTCWPHPPAREAEKSLEPEPYALPRLQSRASQGQENG